jgi:hypothetical protein
MLNPIAAKGSHRQKQRDGYIQGIKGVGRGQGILKHEIDRPVVV